MINLLKTSFFMAVLILFVISAACAMVLIKVFILICDILLIPYRLARKLDE